MQSNIYIPRIQMFFSGHYVGDMSLDLQTGEPWKKVFGPIFIYLNSASRNEDRHTLWADAKEQVFFLSFLTNGVLFTSLVLLFLFLLKFVMN